VFSLKTPFEATNIDADAQPDEVKRRTTPSLYLSGFIKRTKILIIIPTLERGGAEMDLVRVLPWFDKSRFEFLVFTFLARGALAQHLKAPNIEIFGPFIIGAPRLLRDLTHRLLDLLLVLTPKSVRRAGRNYWARLRFQWSRLAPTISETGNWIVGHLPASVRRAFRGCLTWIAYVIVGVGLAPFVRARGVDVIHAVLPNSYVVGSIANYGPGRRPLIMSRVSLNWYQRRDRLYYFVERKLLHRNVDAVVYNCEEISRELQEEGLGGTKLHLIRNGIDVFDFLRAMIDRDAARDRLGMSRDSLIFSVVANLYGYKGHADVLQAIHQVADKLPEWELVLVGRDFDGNRAKLEAMCLRFGIAQRVHFLGERSDVAAVLSAADIHLSGSHSEGLPNNVIEAMCARLPVIATAVGGTKELLVDQETGILVPARDPVRMGQAMLQLAKDRELRARMGEAGLKRVISDFSIDRTLEAFEKLYTSSADRYRSARRTKPTKMVAGFNIIYSRARDVREMVTRPILRAIANAAVLYSDLLAVRALSGPPLRNLLLQRRYRSRLDLPFDFAFHDLTIVRPLSYRPDPRRILLVVPAFGRGGAERMMLATATGLVSRGYEVKLLAFRHVLPAEPHILDEIRRHKLDCQIWDGPALSFRDWWRRFNNKALAPYANQLPAWHYDWAAEVAVAIEDFRPAVVHAWLDQPILIAGAVSCLMGVPRFIGNQQNAVSKDIRALFDPYVRGYRAIALHPSVTLTNCGAATGREYERWLGLPAHSIKVVPNMFWPEIPGRPSQQEIEAYRRELGLSAGCPIVGTVMRLADVKDPHLWLKTAVEVLRSRPDVRFVLGGDGELAEAISEWVDQLDLGGKVILPGAVADVRLVYAISDVVMLTSRSEASPVVFIEAQSAGRPVVGPDVGAVRETVIDGITARIVLDRSAQAFANAVLEILNDPDWSAQAAVRGPAFVDQQFGTDSVIDTTLALYDGRAPAVAQDASALDQSNRGPSRQALRSQR
jgi:glycosyltransferase involved in cell wall biosynthesis